MRILVAIANHGTKNQAFLERLLDEYRAMPHAVDVVVLSDAPKSLGPDVEVRVGAPTSNPWSLPFAHRELFAERVGDYDLYVYSEDDTLLTARHLDAHDDAAAILDADEVPGFLRYEVHPGGSRSYCSVHSGYHWDPASVRRVDGELFAAFTNEHSACYVLTDGQLRHAIASGGFLVEPHEGRYDMLVSAATDPYVHCGLRRLVWVSRIEDFLVHHLPNVYLGQLGITEREWRAQLHALEQIADGSLSRAQLIEPVARVDTAAWDPQYHVRPTAGMLAALRDPRVGSVLSLGCGDGRLERTLHPAATRIVAIPLDEVIGAVARTRGIRTLPPHLDGALDLLSGEGFERVLIHDLLGRVEEPVALLDRVRGLVTPGGEVVLTATNHRYHALRHRTGRELAPPVPRRRGADGAGVRFTDAGVLRSWLRAGGYEAHEILPIDGSRAVRRWGRRLPGLRAVRGSTVAARARCSQSAA